MDNILKLPMGIPTRNAFGEALLESAKSDSRIVVIDGDVHNSTRTEYFKELFPDRFFNLGIAESNMVSVASGMASSGKVPVVASFACFIMCNAFDQLRMSVALPKRNVKIVGSHSGISIGEDGPSQMGIEDVSLACSLPGFTVIVPADEVETREAVRAMLRTDGPFYLRVSRPPTPVVYENGLNYRIGVANTLREGTDITIIANGILVAESLVAYEYLRKEGIHSRIIDMHTVKPIDRETCIKASRETGAIVTAEEHLLDGGLGSQVARVISETAPCPMGFIGIDNTYASSGKPEELLDRYGLTARHIVEKVKEVLKKK